MNKLLVFTFISLLFTVLTTNAQKHELKLRYSPISLTRLDTWNGGGGAYGGTLDHSSKKHPGAIELDYDYLISPKIMIGFNATYDARKITNKSHSSYSTGNNYNGYGGDNYVTDYYKTTSKDRWLMVGPQFSYYYIRNEKFSLGSGAGISLVWNSEEITVNSASGTSNDVDVFFHVEAINFTFGKTNGLTGQIGFGHKGLISLGYFVRW